MLTMSSGGNYFLQWTRHASTMLNTFEKLYLSERMADVTLKVEGQTIVAHKIVLSACSAYFEEAFSACGDKELVLFLKDVQLDDFKYILQFMYKGAVGVPKGRLKEFLRTAESLKVKGLANTKPRKGKRPANIREAPLALMNDDLTVYLPPEEAQEIPDNSHEPSEAKFRKTRNSPNSNLKDNNRKVMKSKIKTPKKPAEQYEMKDDLDEEFGQTDKETEDGLLNDKSDSSCLQDCTALETSKSILRKA